MVNYSRKISIDTILLVYISLSFFYGVLSYQHYAPSSHDFFINSISFILCSIGLLVFYTLHKSLKVSLGSLLWFFLFFIFLVQPIINNITYVDSLVFPLSQILLIFFFR